MPGKLIIPAKQQTYATIEILQLLTGFALAVFMWFHMVLVSSVILGVHVMDTIAYFFESTYLAYIGSPVIVLLFFVHVVATFRKIPANLREQQLLHYHISSLKHHDTTLWRIQLITGLGILILACIHFWVILTDFPIKAMKSAARVQGVYLWFYIPLLIMAEAHLNTGLYRIAIKWGLIERSVARSILLILMGIFLGIGGVTLYIFYKLGEAIK